MATIINNLNTLADWLSDNVCANLEFKKPDDRQNDNSYSYTLVHPDVHIMFLPTRDILTDSRYAVPSILVQFESEHIYPKNSKGSINIRLGFSTWNPGQHTSDAYERNTDGYIDVINFAEYTRDALINEELIGSMRIKLEDGIECGPIKEKGTIVDYYPYWYAYLTFIAEFNKSAIHNKYSNLL